MSLSDDNKLTKKKQNRGNSSLPSPITISFTAGDLERRKIKKAPKLLTRLTISSPDTRDDLEELLAAARAHYDIVAVAPGNDAALVQCCRASSSPDLISFDGRAELGALALHHLPTALQKGAYVELQYDPCVGSSSARARQACLRLHQSVSSAVNGRQVVVGSGAADAGRLRSPADIVHLCSLMGLSDAAAHAALTHTCADLLHACARRRRELIPQPTSDHAAVTAALVPYPVKKKKRKVFDHDLASIFLTNFSSSVKKSKT
ncbi:RNase P subunit p30 [Trinorchestia longiramus]|nr:RNase P subunit p30 [Trinorchestia longiramus]